MRSKRFIAYALIGLVTVSLLSCGYQMGSSKPEAMAGISSIYVEMPDNRTQYPRLEATLANHLVDALIQDGQYKASGFEQADAKLVSTITSVGYNQLSSSRTDALRPEELLMKVNVSWQVMPLNSTASSVVMSGKQTGSTRFYLGDNLQVARQNAFPDALQRVARQIISTFSYNF